MTARGRLIRLSRSLIPLCIPWCYIYPPNIPGVIRLHSETFLLGAGWLFSHVLWFHYYTLMLYLSSKYTWCYMSSLRDLPARGRLTLFSRSLIPLCISWFYIYPPNIPGVIRLHSETFLLGAGWLFSHVLWFHYYTLMLYLSSKYTWCYMFSLRYLPARGRLTLLSRSLIGEVAQLKRRS